MTSQPTTGSTEELLPTGQQRRTEATRRALFAAARTVLEQHGYAGATVAQIARAAGRAHGTFYLYFQNKEDIYAQLLEEMWTDLKEQSRSVWRRDTPLESVRATVARYVSGFGDNVELWRLLDEMSASNPRFTRTRDEYRRAFVQKIKRGIESSGAKARITGMQPVILAELLAGMVDEACALRYLRGRSWPEAELVEHIVTVWGRAVGYLSNGAPATSLPVVEEADVSSAHPIK